MRRPALAALLLALPLAARAAPPDPLVVDLPTDPASIDPHVQWDPDSYAVYRNVFDNVLARDADGAIVGQVASSWHQDDDTHLTLTVRDGIRFQDGSPLTPADVAFSVRRITDPAFHSPQLSQFDQITAATVTGPHAVQLTTRTAYPVLLAQLTKLSVVPEAIVRRDGAAFAQHPVGSGPYSFTSRTPGVSVELAANPSYWRGPPPFAHVQMRAVPDESTRIADLRTGRAQITRILSTDDADQIRSAGGPLQVLWSPTERVTLFELNALDGPTKDPRVRLAIARAIDRDTIVDALLKGYARPVNEPLTPASFGYDPDIPAYGYDPAAARALLKEAGVAPGTRLSFLTSPVFDQRVVQALQQMLSDVGLDAHIDTVDLATFLRLRQGPPAGAGDVAYFRWSCGCQDADGTLFPLFDSASQWAMYRSAPVDQALAAARATLDPAARLADYRAALERIHADVPAVPLFQDAVMFAAARPLRFRPTPGESFFLFDMRWAE